MNVMEFSANCIKFLISVPYMFPCVVVKFNDFFLTLNGKELRYFSFLEKLIIGTRCFSELLKISSKKTLVEIDITLLKV